MKNSLVKRTLLGMSCAVVLAFASCNKEEVKQERKPSAVSSEKISKMQCSPWQDVDAWQLVNELNGFMFCNILDCTEGSSTSITYNHQGITAPLELFQTITVAEQNTIMSDATNWAVTHTPSGFFVHRINFSSHGQTIFGQPGIVLDIQVIYKKCLPGGPLPD